MARVSEFKLRPATLASATKAMSFSRPPQSGRRGRPPRRNVFHTAPRAEERANAALRQPPSAPASQPAPTDPANPNLRVAPVLRPGSPPAPARATVWVLEGGKGHNLLTVRDVAGRLRVSTATVCKLCSRGELVHLRVSNAIRVEPAELEAFTARRRSVEPSKSTR